MKSVHFQQKNNETLLNVKKLKPNQKVSQTVRPKSETSLENLHHRTGSCPENSSWIPSRNWHKYLTGQKISSVPSSPHNSAVCWHSNCYRESSEEPLPKTGDESITIKLPTVNFCSPRKEVTPVERGPSISDLCDEDKQKIANLVEELARCKQQKEEDDQTILRLKSKISEFKPILKKLHADKHTDSKSISLLKSIHESEQSALKKQLSELNQLLYEMQVQKTTSEVQIRTITTQAEKMTRAIHAMHRENTELQVELRLAKERLAVAQQAVEKMTNDLKNVSEHIRPLAEDKACQSSEDIFSTQVHVKRMDHKEGFPEDQMLLSELFFNKSLQNSFTPKETIIFLPADSKEPFNTL